MLQETTIKQNYTFSMTNYQSSLSIAKKKLENMKAFELQ